MMLFAKLRRSAALFICPELGPQPARAGYDGSIKPMARATRDRLVLLRNIAVGEVASVELAALDRAELESASHARAPEERGFFNAEEAQAYDRARKNWIEAEKSRFQELGQGVGEVSRREVVVERVLVLPEQVGQVAGAAEDIARDRGVKLAQTDNKDRQQLLQNTAFGSGVSQDLHLFGGHGAGHHSSPSVDACSDASSSSGGCE